MRLYLINPLNPTVSLSRVKENRFNKYRIWKPLGLMIIARITPPEWDVTIIDENVRVPDYDSLPRPDLVGLTAFTSQASRAYLLASMFRGKGVPVAMGGIHATMRLAEATENVNAVVTGEAEDAWPEVLDDLASGRLSQVYNGGLVDIERVPPARHDLLSTGYAFGSIQTTRGCPLDCSFCSVTAFNGNRFRWRPIRQVVDEFKLIKENLVLIVDDNLIGTSRKHIARAKELFRAMIDAKIGKRWMCQVTTNMGEDEELVRLAAQAGCFGALIGFESPSNDGLMEINKKYNMRKGQDARSSCRTMQRHGIGVSASFIMGLDVDKPGIGKQIVDRALSCGVDSLNVTMMTPFPGTRLWDTMESQGRIAANSFPEDWKYYTLGFPVANYMHLSWRELLDEWISCLRSFYSYPRILGRFLGAVLRTRKVFANFGLLVTNLIYRRNIKLDQQIHSSFDVSRGIAHGARELGRRDGTKRDLLLDSTSEMRVDISAQSREPTDVSEL
ncbi:MAG: B12-binding domain-containing radical SAM protein [Phycisphaerales bacterium]|nr:MAG: B12-binding domain-containing radical SAM protein [Phycisphaerales bacterium]